MNKIYFFLILIIFALSLISKFYTSNKSENTISQALTLAKENRNELEFALNYFDKNEENLKYRAVYFLIENMIGHYSASATLIKNNSHNKAFELLSKTSKNLLLSDFGSKKQKKEIWVEFDLTKKRLDSIVKNIESYSLLQKNFDLNTIKGKWLVNHVNKAFEIWKSSNHLNKDDFNEFKETFLPYRYSDEQLIIPDRYSKKRFLEVLDRTNEMSTRAIIDTLSKLFKNINKLTKSIDFENDLGFYNILKWNNLDCYQQTSISAKLLNSIGVPTYIDFTPCFFHRFEGHAWCVSKTSGDRYLPFSPWWQNIAKSNEKSDYRKNYYNRVSKVYRKTFEYQHISANNFKLKGEIVHPNFNSFFNKDVTDEYHKTTSLSFSLNDIPEDCNIAYLTIFTSKGFKAIAWSKFDRKNRNITFDKVPKGFAYSVCRYIDKNLEPISSLFYLDNTGISKKVKASYNEKLKVKLIKKYPRKERIIDFNKDMINGRFEVSNDKNFRNVKPLYTFKCLPKNHITNLNIDNPNKFRYFRFITEKKKQSSMAILECFTELSEQKDTFISGSLPYVFDSIKKPFTSDNITKIEGTYMSSKSNADAERLTKPFDGKMETFSTDYWIGLDFKKKVRITNIRYAARNANNMINIGNEYELFFYNDEWISLGRKKAEFNYLIWDNVPKDTFYWLKNKTNGVEELPFIYDNEKQYFVNYDNIDFYFNRDD